MTPPAGEMPPLQHPVHPARELPPPHLPTRSRVPALAGVAICLLLAVCQIALAGYALGVGNQGIQIAFLKRWSDPALFTSDIMVRETMPLYPSYFFRILSVALAWTDVASLYAVMQIVTAFLTLATVYALSRSIYRMHAAALAAAGLLVAGHLQGLAGDGLYSQGFTHTFAAFPFAIGALALAYRGRWLWAFALAGVLFNIHALTSAYTLLMLGAALLADIQEKRLPSWLLRTALCGGIALLLAAPTLALMLSQRQVFDAQWVDLMRIRSAEHSFPTTWWRTSNPDVPRFILVFALFVLSWSFSPVRLAAHTGAGANVRRAARVTVWMTLAVVALFIGGYVFSELVPVPLVIRLQPFRASRLLMVLMLVHIAHGAVTAIRAGASGIATGQTGDRIPLPALHRFLELVSGIAILITLGIPSLLPMLPLTLLLALLTAAVVGHLSWRQSIVAVGALLVAILAWRQIQFSIPFLSEHSLTLLPAGGLGSFAADSLGWLALGVAVLLAVAISLIEHRTLRWGTIALAAVLGLMLSNQLFLKERAEPAAGDGTTLAGAAAWARDHTDKKTTFLLPSGLSNFRILADRALVGDWRDGTQLYFCAGFGPEWLERVSAIEPGFTRSDDGKRLISRGDPLETLPDAALVDLAKKYNASYLVLHTPPAQAAPRALVPLYKDDQFTVYEPRLLKIATTRDVPQGVVNPAEWNAMQDFMDTTVAQNIEKYRKADLTLQLVDASGRPVQDLPLLLDQTRHAFTFGGSLGFFEPNNINPADGDQRPALVRPIELEKLPEVFNGSLIPFSGKWAFIEPERGQYRWTDLDKYVDYCTANGLTMEFHHLSGTRPQWTDALGGVGNMTGLDFPPATPIMQQEFNRHCLAVVDRYAGRIKYFQVVNEKYMMQYVPAAMRLLKEKYPNVQFGVSDCVNFYPQGGGGLLGMFTRGAGGRGQYKGLDAVKWLKDQGVQPDFFSLHGHHPSNNWPDPREMYKVFDTVQAEGGPKMRLHVSEEYTQLNGSISGTVRSGILTPALQGELLSYYFTVCFSHPSMDMANVWGAMANLGGGTSNSGLVDQEGKTRPAFTALKKLFTETWHSRVAEPLPLDGTLTARVFHGTYRLALTLPNGKTIETKLTVPEQPTAKLKVKYDAARGTLELLEPGN